jgi:hypothetical protein
MKTVKVDQIPNIKQTKIVYLWVKGIYVTGDIASEKKPKNPQPLTHNTHSSSSSKTTTTGHFVSRCEFSF